MNNRDITNRIIDMHIEETMEEIAKEMKEEESSIDRKAALQELEKVIMKVRTEKKPFNNNVTRIQFLQNRSASVVTSFDSVELLAAAGQSLRNWFSSPIAFTEYGFTVDIRKTLGSDIEIDIYLNALPDKINRMKSSLAEYAGKNLRVILSDENLLLLESELFVDELATAAEGSGVLLNNSASLNIKGKLKLELLVDK